MPLLALLVCKLRNSLTVLNYSFVKVWKRKEDVFTQEERTVVETHRNSFLENMLPVRYWCYDASRGTPPAFVFYSDKKFCIKVIDDYDYTTNNQERY